MVFSYQMMILKNQIVDILFKDILKEKDLWVKALHSKREGSQIKPH